MERKKLELELNKQTHIEMLFDQPKIGESQYGEYYLYAVRNGNGNEYSFFAPEEVHDKLKDLSKGDSAVITKTAIQKGNKVVTNYDVAVAEVSNQSSSSKDKHSTSDPKSAEENSSTYFKAMVDSFEEAIRIQEKFNGMANVNQIAITLFIQRTKSNK